MPAEKELIHDDFQDMHLAFDWSVGRLITLPLTNSL
jgi:hypothetical protein